MFTTSIRRGFTLIELIVSLSIITLILSFTFASVNSSRARSRDAKRIADLQTLQSALEQHALGDSSRSYPPDVTLLNSSLPADLATLAAYCTKYKTAGQQIAGIYNNPCFKDYLSVVPKDPNGQDYTYHRPACFTVSGERSTMTYVSAASRATSCPATNSNQIYKQSYGLHVDLETENVEAKSDLTPTAARSYDLAP